MVTGPTGALVVLCSCPDEATADRIAGELVGERLAACVSRLPGLRSTYRWEGRLQSEPETLLIIKTSTGRFAALEMRLKALHPYEVPEIIALPVVAGSSAYLDWVAAESCAST
ncbi:MAG TPA: divalent-cation tolerance protein CutA [Steroidobacteraceae bacterium]|nr:divalent-cation tolerance protein CutA [Steroidobacteraceae bacterium]